ncbi:MAG: hypothetical protein K2G31_04165, partial [Clostridia bacterium]|nr:hypothetical protein [Clostridia bacterium]
MHIVYDNGRYDGPVDKNNKPHGHGVMTFSDGSKYDGEWRDALMHGHGAMTWRDGTKYNGEWRDGKR